MRWESYASRSLTVRVVKSITEIVATWFWISLSFSLVQNESTVIAADGNSLEITPRSSTLTVRVAKTITEIVTTWFWSLDV